MSAGRDSVPALEFSQRRGVLRPLTFLNQETVLLLTQRHHRKPALPDQWRILEQLVCLDFCQRWLPGESAASLDFYLGILRIVAIYGNHRGRAYNALLVSGVIDDQLRARLHGAQVL